MKCPATIITAVAESLLCSRYVVDTVVLNSYTNENITEHLTMFCNVLSTLCNIISPILPLRKLNIISLYFRGES